MKNEDFITGISIGLASGIVAEIYLPVWAVGLALFIPAVILIVRITRNNKQLEE